MYNISVSGCSTTRIHYDSFDLSPPSTGSSCKDYVQLLYNNNAAMKKCSNDVEGTNELIAAAEFLVVFFTDRTVNDRGFQIRSQCG